MVISVPPSVKVSAPPMVQSTAMNVIAESEAVVTPTAKSTGASVDTRKSSVSRPSGF